MLLSCHVHNLACKLLCDCRKLRIVSIPFEATGTFSGSIEHVSTGAMRKLTGSFNLQTDSMPVNSTFKLSLKLDSVSCLECNQCIKDLSSYIPTVQSLSDAAQVASSWAKYCAEVLKRDAVQCEFVRQSIAKSTNGNTGKRPGQLCRLLEQCPASIVGTCDVQNAAATGKLDTCRCVEYACTTDVSNVTRYCCSSDGLVTWQNSMWSGNCLEKWCSAFLCQLLLCWRGY